MKTGTILYVGNFELPDQGASANRVVSNGKLLESIGYRVVFLGVGKQKPIEGIQTLDAKRHMYEEAYPRGSKDWLIHMCSTRHIRQLVSQYKDTCMIILYNVPFPLLWATKRLYKKTNIKVVYDCTEWTGVTEGSLLKRLVKWVDEYFIRKYIHKVADGLIVISRRMEEQYKECKRLIRIPPLVDIKDSIWHQNIQKSEERFEFCFAGMLDGNKESLDKIVEAFCKREDTSSFLRIIGVDKEDFIMRYPNLKLIVEDKKEQILFMGRLSHRETIGYVQNCDCYIFIRQSDRRNNAGFPTKFTESFTCGIPIIATDISDLKQYVKTEEQGIILSSISIELIQKAMMQVQKSYRTGLKKKNTLNEMFHYETYRRNMQEWINLICK